MAKMTALAAIAAALVCAPVALVAQNKAATYITKEQVDIVNKQPGTDRTFVPGSRSFRRRMVRSVAPVRRPDGGSARPQQRSTSRSPS